MLTSGLSVFFENAAGQVLEHPDGYALVRHHAGKRKADDLNTLVACTGRLLMKRSWHRVLDDQRHMAPLTPDEKQWVLEKWYTGQTDRPVYIITAVVVPDDVVARLSSRQMWNEVPPGIFEYHTFTELEEAQGFLMDLAEELW
ncbi:hypothetical protein GCM10023185_19710 [Hymenobacter saemangeumensis]|uniref:STAS/SEC14 domain-containing protein n=1 Tax=Hymenobacter saemangeumensis TaxID=1084522 RepID=A0ABP8ICZ7_9BACT